MAVSVAGGSFLVLAIVIAGWAAVAAAGEFRAYWVDTFHTPLGTHSDIDRVIALAEKSHSNAIFVEVRRRGDSWYLESKEPLTEVAGVGEPDANGRWTFDPFRYIIEQAHARDAALKSAQLVDCFQAGDLRPAAKPEIGFHHQIRPTRDPFRLRIFAR